MALVCLHYSDYFENNLISGKMKGTILEGKWDIPVESKLFVYMAMESVEASKEDKKIGNAKIISCRQMRVSELSDKEAKACVYKSGEAFRQGVRYWHKCKDSDVITFIEFKFKKL